MAVGDVDLEGMYKEPPVHTWVILARKANFTSEFTSDPAIGKRFEQLAARWPENFTLLRVTAGLVGVAQATEVGVLNHRLPESFDGYQYAAIKEASATAKTKIV